jgi:opacity protein-like surface antigen
MGRRSFARPAFTGTGALVLSLALPAAAAAEPQSWYVGATSDDTHVEVYRGLGWEVGGEERGFSLLGGWQINRRFSVELAARRATSLEWTEYFAEIPGYLTSHTTFDATAVQASGVATFQWGKTVEAFLKVGLAQYRIDGRQVLDTLMTDAALTRDVDASGSDYLLGAGIAVKATPKWRVRFEYQYFGIDRDFLGVRDGGDPTIDTFALGIDYRIGRRPEATVNALR